MAGCVIARRLVENGRHSVLVLEAGPVPAPGLEIPAIRSRFFGNNSEFIRNYNSIPQNTPGLAKNRIMPYTVGHTLGGGSSINGNLWININSLAHLFEVNCNRCNVQCPPSITRDNRLKVKQTQAEMYRTKNILPRAQKNEGCFFKKVLRTSFQS